MKLIRYVLLGFVLVTSLASAQTDSTERAKMIGLRFSFNGLNLGGGLGGKYWLSSQSALACGINFAINSAPSSDAQTSLGFSSQYEYHFLANHQLTPYLAGGANFGFGIITDNNSAGMRVSRTSFSIGASAIIGVEFFIVPAISLAGQQAIGATYTQYPNVNVPQLRQERWDIGLGSSSLILHIYLGRI